MVFGIDLGTTNSLIGSGDQLFSGLVSSNVDIKEWKQVPRDEVSETIVSSYKVDMSMGDTGKLPIKCSSVILKELARQAQACTGEEVKDVVISVPAYFTSTKREAVMEAGKQAGLNVLGLINEPTAAGLYTCKGEPGLFAVYDLGGGTFDISIIDNRAGICSVLNFDGSNVGGDDLDEALMKDVFESLKVPMRCRTALNKRTLTSMMRLAKERIQNTRSAVWVSLEPLNLDMRYQLTVERYKEIILEVFGDTIEKTKYLISASIPEVETPKIVFVGGSTHCPFLREMVLEETGLEEIPSKCSPDQTVALGVAYYADLLGKGLVDRYIEDVTKRLCIEGENGVTMTIIESKSIIPCSNTIVVSNNKRSDTLSLKLYQGESVLAANNEYIGTLVYDYGCMQEPDEGVVDVTATVNRDGVILLKAEDLITGETQEITLTAR